MSVRPQRTRQHSGNRACFTSTDTVRGGFPSPESLLQILVTKNLKKELKKEPCLSKKENTLSELFRAQQMSFRAVLMFGVETLCAQRTELLLCGEERKYHWNTV